MAVVTPVLSNDVIVTLSIALDRFTFLKTFASTLKDYTAVQKTGLLLYFQMSSTNTDQYPQFLVQKIRNESPMFTCVTCEF